LTEAVFQGQILLTWQNEALFLIIIWFNSSSSCRGLEPEPWQHAISSGGVDNEKIWDLAHGGNVGFGAGLRQSGR
jgi:hypothetical protein